ncbi:alternative ribosome rescue factor ArfA [Bacillus thuringiensis]|nr:alternative ribosome rescue factor ArfA [Bacillus thuringiensis]
MKDKSKDKRTIGERSNSRKTWSFNASTQVVPNKKGKGSYSRKNEKINES